MYEDDLKELVNRYGEEAAKKLEAYMDGILEWNERINLTAIRERGEFLVKHIFDSLSAFGLPEFEAARSVIDVGTGGGFPGVPLAVVSPEKSFLLLDSTKKKLRVVDDLTGRLEIGNVATLHARAEEIFRKDNYSEKFDLCVSRAVAELDTLAGWCLPFVRKGGAFIAYKGSKAAEELDAARKTIDKLGAKDARIIDASIPGSSAEEHKLIVISK